MKCPVYRTENTQAQPLIPHFRRLKWTGSCQTTTVSLKPNLHGRQSLFLLFHVEGRIREKEKVKYFHVRVCVYVSYISLPFVCSWHPWLREGRKRERKKKKSTWNETSFESLAFHLVVVIKRANLLRLNEKKEAEIFLLSPPTFSL